MQVPNSEPFRVGFLNVESYSPHAAMGTAH